MQYVFFQMRNNKRLAIKIYKSKQIEKYGGRCIYSECYIYPCRMFQAMFFSETIRYKE